MKSCPLPADAPPPPRGWVELPQRPQNKMPNPEMFAKGLFCATVRVALGAAQNENDFLDIRSERAELALANDFPAIRRCLAKSSALL